MKPSKADRKKFDLDLQYGEVREERVAEMLQDKKIEVKSEKDLRESTTFGMCWIGVIANTFGFIEGY